MADAPPSFAAILVMAGSGTRFGGHVPKVYLPLAGMPLWRHAARTLAALPGLRALVLVVAPERVAGLRLAAADLSRAVVVAGGTRRQDSVRLGLAALPEAVDVVAVHDAARPLLDSETAQRAIAAAARHGAALAAVRVTDTIKDVRDDGVVVGTPDRSRLWQAQTPQCFRMDLLLRAHEAALRDGVQATDDAALVEALGGKVHVSPGHAWNIKVTGPADLRLAEALLRLREEGLRLQEEDS